MNKNTYYNNLISKLKQPNNLKSIGFFGDSFCANAKAESYETFIMKLVKKNNCKISNLGQPGSSIWDAILLQFLPLFNKDQVPDNIIFVWTDWYRLFHRQVRDINTNIMLRNTKNGGKQGEIYKVANLYYDNFLDKELMQFQYASALKYFDEEILSKLPPDKKIIHLRAYDMPWLQEYNFKWKHGIEINPELELLTSPETLHYENHIYGEENNQILFERIQNALENWDSIQLEKHSGIK
jgi:hypothetical protein